MNQNRVNEIMLDIVSKVIKIKNQEQDDYTKGQLDAYIDVLKLSGLTDDDINEIMKGKSK